MQRGLNNGQGRSYQRRPHLTRGAHRHIGSEREGVKGDRDGRGDVRAAALWRADHDLRRGRARGNPFLNHATARPTVGVPTASTPLRRTCTPNDEAAAGSVKVTPTSDWLPCEFGQLPSHVDDAAGRLIEGAVKRGGEARSAESSGRGWNVRMFSDGW